MVPKVAELDRVHCNLLTNETILHNCSYLCVYLELCTQSFSWYYVTLILSSHLMLSLDLHWSPHSYFCYLWFVSVIVCDHLLFKFLQTTAGTYVTTDCWHSIYKKTYFTQKAECSCTMVCSSVSIFGNNEIFIKLMNMCLVVLFHVMTYYLCIYSFYTHHVGTNN